MNGAAMNVTTIWTVIIGLGLASALIRYSFLGILQGREVPPRLKTVLEFVPVTVIPAMAAPMVVLQPRSEDWAEPHRALAALIALGTGIATRSMVATVVAGMAAFVALRAAGL
jgi:branched-subunit amino acid transport protein